MKLLLVLVIFGAALAFADEAEQDSPKSKRGVQGTFHYATGPFALHPRIVPAPVPVPVAPVPFHAPYPVAAPVPVLPPPHLAYAPTAVGFAPSAVAVPAPIFKPVHVPVAVPLKVAYRPVFARKYRIRVRIPPLLRLQLR